MAELATGAVSTLLGVLSHEAARLGRVRGDMQFIREEMESMSSFLTNLGGTSREHDEQVRTWMNQVRILANDCNSCIDLYLFRGDPEFHRPKAGVRRLLWWAPWLLRKVLAQHRAAGQLKELKDRARDIGERRLRYGVEAKAGQPSSAYEGHEEVEEEHDDDEEEEEEEEEDHQEEDDHNEDNKVTDMFTTIMNMKQEDYLKYRIGQWIEKVVTSKPLSQKSIAFLVPNAKDAAALPNQALEVVKAHPKRGAEEDTPIKWDVVLVDVPEVHFYFETLGPDDILYYILHELSQPQQNQQQQGTTPTTTTPNSKWDIYSCKWGIYRGIVLKVRQKIADIKTKICQKEPNPKDDNTLKQKSTVHEPLHQLLRWLIKSTMAAEQEDQENRLARELPAQYDRFIEDTAKKLKEEIEMVNPGGGSNQQAPEYEDILREVFPRPTTAGDTTTSTNSTIEDQIKEILQGVKGMLHELRELDKNSNEEPTREPSETWEAVFKEATDKKMDEIRMKVTLRVAIKRMVIKIKECLGDDKKRILVILKTDDDKHVPIWEETRKALNQLGCTAIGGAMIVATNTTLHKKYDEDVCYPQLEPIEYPLVGRFIDTVLQSTGQTHMHEVRRRIVRDILYECEPDEFCMKIFAHALYAKPKRSTQELRKLHTILQATEKSSPIFAGKMLNFSYKDLPKQYRSCLLYLAIFPKRLKIRRSTLIGRWVAEGLITTKEWRWSSSVLEAEKCFDALIARYLVYPTDTGASGRVKNCKVHTPVRKYITKIAMKQGILDTRLSYHLAHHFSIFSDVRLRMSEKVENFLENIPKSSQFSKLKVLDLEGCLCFQQNKGYLTDVCSKILMLKYLSLRETDVDHLPRAIKNLHELEVLDIRQTKIPASETRNVLLRKLKRLLAGHQIDSTPGSSPAQYSGGVQIPEKIEKMEDVEVLSNVEPRNWHDLTDIAKLSMLKKLGVVIKEDSDLRELLVTINDLYQSLRSLSITLNIKGTRPQKVPVSVDKFPNNNVLESLSITGRTEKWNLLTRFANRDAKQLAKVTLSGTSLSEDDFEVLANVPNLRCVRLRHIVYTRSNIIFTECKFRNLNNFLIEGSNITEIRFEKGAANKLEKMVWSFTKMDSLSGIDNLLGLKELELNGETIPIEVQQDMEIQRGRLHYKRKTTAGTNGPDERPVFY